MPSCDLHKKIINNSFLGQCLKRRLRSAGKFSSIPNTEHRRMVKILKLAENLAILLTEMNLLKPVLPCDFFFFYITWQCIRTDSILAQIFLEHFCKQ